MKRLLIATAMAALAATLAWADIVKLRTYPGIGDGLTDKAGMTLYINIMDNSTSPVCRGECLETWPPFYDVNIYTPYGLDAADFGVVPLPGGQKQSTFRGYPLHYYSGDGDFGQSKGHKEGDWRVAVPAEINPLPNK